MKNRLSFVECEPEEMFMEPDDSQLDFIEKMGIDAIAELDRLPDEETLRDELFNMFRKYAEAA